MPQITIVQPSFAAGELSPRLFGRVDLAKYASGAERIENFLVRPEGGLMRRHGTRFVGEARNPSGRSRLIPFIFSTVQAYMLEFGDQTIRVWKDFAPVTVATKLIQAIDRANPARVTAFAHGFSNGTRVTITGVAGMGEVNNREFTVANTTADTFELSGIDATAFGTYQSGGIVSEIYEIASPYTQGELDQIYVSQSADTLYLTHPAHAPRMLTRTGHTNWTLASLPLERGPFAPPNSDEAVRVLCQTTGSYQPGAGVTVKASAPIFTSAHANSYFRLQEIYLADQSVSPWAPAAATANALGTQVSSHGHVYALADAGTGTKTGTVAPSHDEGDAWDNPIGAEDRKKWRYLHSRWSIVRLNNFIDAKTMSGTITTYLCNGLAPVSKPIAGIANAAGLCRVTVNAHGYGEGDVVSIANVAGATQANGDWRIINVTANTFDLANSSAPAAYIAGGTAQRYATWLWAHGAFSQARGYPAAVALHEQRLVFANTKAQPFGLWASASADYGNFLPGTRDDETIAYNIAANQADPIRWLTSGSDLVIGTLSQEFAAYGGGLGDPITPANTRIVPQSGEGANGVQPVKIGIETLFVNRAGRKLFSLANQADVAAYVSTDLLELADHLTLNEGLLGLAWAKNPSSLLWALRSDGIVLALTYRREQQVFAWSRHEFGGVVESIAVIPSPDGRTDDLWLIVRREDGVRIRRTIEYLAPPFEPRNEEDKSAMGFLDSALSYQGTPVSAVSGLAHLEGEQVGIVTDGALHPDRIVQGGRVTLQSPASAIWVGLKYESRLRTLRIDVPALGTAQGKLKRIPRVTIRVLNTIGGRAGPSSGLQNETLVPRYADDKMNASPPLRSGDFDVNLACDFELAGRLEIVQPDPLPLDILAIMPVVSLSEA